MSTIVTIHDGPARSVALSRVVSVIRFADKGNKTPGFHILSVPYLPHVNMKDVVQKVLFNQIAKSFLKGAVQAYLWSTFWLLHQRQFLATANIWVLMLMFMIFLALAVN